MSQQCSGEINFPVKFTATKAWNCVIAAAPPVINKLTIFKKAHSLRRVITKSTDCCRNAFVLKHLFIAIWHFDLNL